MKKLLLTAAIAGLLIGGPAMAQTTNQNSNQTGKSENMTTQSDSKVAPSGERQRVRSDATTRDRGERGSMREHGERRTMREGDRRERSSVNVRIGGDGYGYRHRHHRGYYAYGGGCRTIIVKKHYHGRTIVKRIRRCG